MANGSDMNVALRFQADVTQALRDLKQVRAEMEAMASAMRTRNLGSPSRVVSAKKWQDRPMYATQVWLKTGPVRVGASRWNH